MKNPLLGATALAALTATAQAADLPMRSAPPPVAFAPVPVFTWTGFYAGFNAGYGFGTGDDKNSPTLIGVPANGLLTNAGTPTAGTVAFGNKSSNEGFAGGGQIGYNWQLTPGSGFVVGVEADAQYVDFGRDRNRAAFLPAGTSPAAGVTFFNPNGLSGLDYFGTVRGRLGYAFDRTLLYGTGGFAYGSGGGREFGLPNSSEDKFQTGWAAGAGIEYALPTDSFLNFFKSSAVTLKVEGLYVNLDRRNRNNGAFAADSTGNVAVVGRDGVLVSGPGSRRNETEFAVVRAGLNYKFGSY